MRAIQAGSDGALLAQVTELIAYLSNNSSRLVNYGQRSRAGLPVSTSTAESAVVEESKSVPNVTVKVSIGIW